MGVGLAAGVRKGKNESVSDTISFFPRGSGRRVGVGVGAKAN